jgi:hypothetical protein
MAGISLLKPLGETVAFTIGSLLAFNTLVAVVCLVLRPQRWTRRLCAITGYADTILVAGGLACGAAGLLDESKVDLMPYAVVYLIVVVQWAALRLISYYRLRDPSALWWPR